MRFSVKCLDTRKSSVEVVLLAVRHMYAVGDVLFGSVVDVLAVERHEEGGSEQHERKCEACEEQPVSGDPKQRMVDHGAAWCIPAQVRVLDELYCGDEVHGAAGVSLDLVAERRVVFHVGVELRALALLHQPFLVLAPLLLADERLDIQLDAREDEATAPESKCKYWDVQETIRDQPRVPAHTEHACCVCITNINMTDFKKIKLEV